MKNGFFFWVGGRGIIIDLFTSTLYRNPGTAMNSLSISFIQEFTHFLDCPPDSKAIFAAVDCHTVMDMINTL